MYALFAFLLVGTTPEPLPDHIDIPNDHSTVICPSEQAAAQMLNSYYKVKPAPNNHITDTDLFFAGLKATGCTQAGGPVTITKVHRRLNMALAHGSERFIHYSGTDAKGTLVHGIVSEDSNNGFPRTEVASWMQERGNNGWLDSATDRSSDWIFFRCDSVEQARRVVTALGKRKAASDKAFLKALSDAALREKCRKATDRYFVTAKFESVGQECGFECFYDVNALEALDRSGLKVGLIFDGSLM